MDPSRSFLRLNHNRARVPHLSSGGQAPFLQHCRNYRCRLRFPLFWAFDIDTNAEVFSLLGRSMFLAKPPPKRKTLQWSLDAVLELLYTQEFDSETASPEKLLMKTLFLSALASGNRVSELAAVIRQGLSLSHNRAVLPTAPGFLLKNQSIRNPQAPVIEFPALKNGHPLCPVRALQTYLTKTSDLHHSVYLFVNYKTGAPLKAGRLSYWLAKTIKLGDDAAIRPAGHYVRKFEFSVAWTRGVNAQKIMKNGFWHSPNITMNKYLSHCGPISSNVVAGRSR